MIVSLRDGIKRFVYVTLKRRDIPRSISLEIRRFRYKPLGSKVNSREGMITRFIQIRELRVIL